MTLTTTTHLNFRGTARAALEFYHSVFGGQLAAISYNDAKAVQDPAQADQIMWGQVEAGNGFRIMAYDVPSSLDYDAGQIPFFLSLGSAEADELRSFWDKLAAGATVVVPLAPAGWSPLYGMLKDRFGVTWVLNLPAQARA